VLTGAKHPPYGVITSPKASLRLLAQDARTENWLNVSFSVLDPGKDIDIIVLVPPNPLMRITGNGNGSTVGIVDSIMLGTDCEFLGFPYGGGWPSKWSSGEILWMPYVKHCTVSAVPSGTPNILILDGINNEGFSGGPVIFKTGTEQKIGAVISGYHIEPAEVISTLKDTPPPIPDPKDKKEVANVNSGFIIAYPIQPAIDAIHENPIGPLRH
jgi:hypothetical protein